MAEDRPGRLQAVAIPQLRRDRVAQAVGMPGRNPGAEAGPADRVPVAPDRVALARRSLRLLLAPPARLAWRQGSLPLPPPLGVPALPRLTRRKQELVGVP